MGTSCKETSASSRPADPEQTLPSIGSQPASPSKEPIMFAAIHCMMRMERTNTCSYALTWVDVGFKARISSSVYTNALFPMHVSLVSLMVQLFM